MNSFNPFAIIIGLIWVMDLEAIISLEMNKLLQNTNRSVSELLESNASSPLRLFFELEPERRSNHIDTIWKWDIWCQLQPVRGNCTKKLTTAFYYDSQLGECMKFEYSGCGGNRNNFKSLIQCERYCKGTGNLVAKTSSSTICALQPNSGLCLSLVDRWYYNVNTRSCNKFVYGGCGGNDNRFKTLDKCTRQCKHSYDKTVSGPIN